MTNRSGLTAPAHSAIIASEFDDHHAVNPQSATFPASPASTRSPR